MAEIQQSDNKRKRGGTRSKKLSTRVDLTPMVDLGFLLITFFIFTTTLGKPMAMKLVVPKESKDSTNTPVSKTINLILEGNNRVAYYKGEDIQAAQTTDFSATGLREVIQSAKNRLPNRNDLIVLIKPSENSSYQNIIATLDEMKINDVRTYVLMEMNNNEKKNLKFAE